MGMTTKSGINTNWWHIISMNWGGSNMGIVGSKTWVTQLALPTQDRRGLKYRTGNSTSYGSWVDILDVTNYAGTLDGRYLKKTGDTMVGTLGMGANTIYWKENGSGDKFGLTPYFSGTDDSNYLAFMSSVGAAGTDPTMTAKMVLTGLGNVGIGTTTPTQKLHVIGGGLFAALLTTTGITNNGTLTQNGDIIINQASTTGTRQVRFQGGDNDYGRVAYGGTAFNAGWMEIASGDGGNEPIYARQYTGIFTTVKRTATLLDANGNTVFPGTVTAPTFTGALNGTAEWSKRLATNSQLTFGLSGLTYFSANLGAGTAANQNVGPTAQWWHILRMNHGNSAGYFADIAVPLNTSGGIYWRRIQGGTNYGWYRVLDTNNYAGIIDGKFLPLAGGKMTSGARISHDGNLYIGNSDSAGWVALQNICSQNSIGDGVWSIRTNGNAIFTTIKKVGSSDSYVLLGGGGHKALNQFIYSTYGSYGVNERTGNSDNLGRAGFWRDNNLGAYGVTLMHSESANYQCKIYHDYGTGGNLYMKSRANGTWGNIYTIWNSGNFDPNTKVNKAGDTMTGALKVMNILLQNNGEINCETNTLFLQYRGSKGIRLCNNNQPLTYGSSNYTIYHTGNLSLNNYVKKTGDTMTGNLQVGQVVIGNTNEVNATDSGNVLYLGHRNTPGGVNICYNNAPLTYGSAKYTIYHSGNISSVLNKRRVPGEVVDFYVYQVNGYTCTSTDYTTFRNQLFDSSGRGKSSVSYKATSSSMTYTVNLSDFVLARNGISAYSNGMYTAGGGELESDRIGRTAGANSKTITGYEMPKHAHWFGRYRSDNANDRDVFGPDGGQNHSTNGTTSAGQGGNWRTGYSGNGQSKDWRPKTIFVFKMVYAPQSW